MVRETESWFTLKDGTKLFEKTWEPNESPNAHLIFLHGFSDRSEIHYYLFPTLASAPYSIQVHAIDQRGWGKSCLKPAQRGLTGPTDQVLSDIHEYVQHVSNLNSGPLFLMGHSMGGQELLCYILSTSATLTSDHAKISGIIVEAPYLELEPASQPSSLLVMAGKLAAKVLPKMQMKQKLESKYITRDPEVNKAWAEDPLCHDMGTLEGLRDMLQRGADLTQLSNPSNEIPSSLSTTLPVPTLWAHGTGDKICWFNPSKALFDRLNTPPPSAFPSGVEGKTFREFRDAYHKIHAEPDGLGESFARDVGDWIVGIARAGRRAPNADPTDQEQGLSGEAGLGDGGDEGLRSKL